MKSSITPSLLFLAFVTVAPIAFGGQLLFVNPQDAVFKLGGQCDKADIRKSACHFFVESATVNRLIDVQISGKVFGSDGKIKGGFMIKRNVDLTKGKSATIDITGSDLVQFKLLPGDQLLIVPKWADMVRAPQSTPGLGRLVWQVDRDSYKAANLSNFKTLDWKYSYKDESELQQ